MIVKIDQGKRSVFSDDYHDLAPIEKLIRAMAEKFEKSPEEIQAILDSVCWDRTDFLSVL